jgi:glycosyltransferase involved in cell wall biosynthesis
MDLLIVHLAYVFGGAERSTARLLQHLDRNKITRLTLAAPNELRRFLPTTYDTFYDLSAHGIGGGFGGTRKLLSDAKRTAKLLDEIQPDVVFGMMHYPSALITLGRLFSNVKPKTVVSFRGPFFEYMRYHEQGWRRRTFLRTAITISTRLADRIIVNSYGTGIELQRRFFAPKHRIKLIPNGIDHIEVMQLSQQSIPELEKFSIDIPIVCAVARLEPEKNLQLLLEAFRIVRSQQTALLIILGDGRERAQLEAQVATWKLSESVKFLGHQDNVYKYLRRAQVFVHTCQFEGFGNTMLEALASGTTVIATDCPYGPREILNDDYGILVSMNDVQELALAIMQILSNETLRLQLIERGMKRAKSFTIEAMIHGYEMEFMALAVLVHPNS